MSSAAKRSCTVLTSAFSIFAILVALAGLAGAVPSANVNDDGHWDETLTAPGLNGEVSAFAVSGGDLYVAGWFSRAFIDGEWIDVDGIARWDGTTWHPMPGVFDDNIAAVAAGVNGEVYIGGSFTHIGDLQVNGVAMWQDGAWHALGTGIRYPDARPWVQALAVDGAGNLFAGGEFSHAGEVAANSVAMWDGNTWQALEGGITQDGWPAQVFALAAGGGKLYVGGRFGQAGGAPARNIAAWDGEQWDNPQHLEAKAGGDS